MKINNWKQLDRSTLFFCYSRNLYKFLKYHKKIVPVAIDINTKITPNKKFSVFIKSDSLQICLDEWKRNKEDGKLFFKK